MRTPPEDLPGEFFCAVIKEESLIGVRDSKNVLCCLVICLSIVREGLFYALVNNNS